MKKSTKIRIIVSVLLLVAAIVLCIVFDGIHTGAHTQMWQRAIYIVCFVGTALGAILGMLLGWKGYVYSYAALSLVIMPRLLPEPWDGISVAAFFGALLIWTAISKRQSRSSDSQDEEEPEPELTEDELRLAEKLRPLTVVLDVWSGRRYQLVSRDKALLGYYIGSDFKGIDENLLQTGDDFRQPDKADIVIPCDAIRSIKIRKLPHVVVEQAVIKTAGKKYRFSLMAADEESSLVELMKGIAPGKTTVIPLKARAKAAEQRIERGVNTPMPDMGRVRVFRVLKVCFGVYLGLVNLPWLFIDVPYKLFSILSVIALPVLLMAYICFPNELTMLEDKECKHKVSLASLMVFSTAIPALRSLLDFNFVSARRLLLVTGVVFALLFLVAFLNSAELRSRKWVMLTLVIFLLFYSFGAAAQINYVFDNSSPASQQAVMLDKHISRSRRGPDSYYIKLRLTDGEEMQIKVGSDQYETYTKGDRVTVYTFDGALDISYMYAD